MSLMLPALDGRLELKSLLGEGGMGQVHRAWDSALERAVAVKFLRGTDPKEAERLLLEARLQARVEHPNVVHVHEVGTLEGRPCIVMQLVEGRTLAGPTREAPLAVRVELLREAALGLHAAHLQGLVHRDVKPGNVLVETTESGGHHALVSDFGLARDEEGGFTQSGLPAGTLDFMAPEVLLDGGPVDFRVDIYALGATAYALLSGHLPFRKTTQPQATEGGSQRPTQHLDDTQLLRRILEEEPTPLLGVPPDLRTIVAKAMEKAPADRYASAEAFADDLGRFLRGEPVLARRAPLGERLVRWSRHNRTAARALAVAAMAVVAGIGAAAWISRRSNLEALAAARLGAEASTMRESLRAEYLAPAHDLRPAREALRKALRSLEQRPGVQGSGAGAFAIGTGRELLDDHDGARASFEEAWRLGFRTPEAAAALGEALARQYELEVKKVGESLDQAAQKVRLAKLEATYAEPARRLLSLGARGGWQEPYLQGRIALLDGRHAAARDRAAEALTAAPQRYEALMLEGEAWVREGRSAANDQKFQVALRSVERALECLEQATAWGRSDPDLHELITRAYRIRALTLQRQGQDPLPAVQDAERSAARTLALDPEAWMVRVDLGIAFETRALYFASTAPKQAMDPLEHGLRHLRRAAELAPTEVEALAQLAYAQYVLGALQRILGGSGREALEEGLRVIAQAHQLAPDELTVDSQEASLAQELGAALRDEGLDGTEALHRSVAACERLLRMEGIVKAQPREILGKALVKLGMEDWLAGRDPRPNLARAVEAADASRLEKPEAADSATQMAEPIAALAEAGLLVGDDVKPTLQRGLAAFDAVKDDARNLGLFKISRAGLVLVDARRQWLGGQNPLPRIGEARSALLREKAFTAQPDVRLGLAKLDLMEGAWRISQAQDGSSALRAAEQRLKPFLQETSPPLEVLDALAEVALWRARAARTAARSPAPLALEGLSRARAALAKGGQHASRRLLEARLLALAGRGEEARKARDAAAAANPLVRGGAEWRAALAEAGR